MATHLEKEELTKTVETPQGEMIVKTLRRQLLCKTTGQVLSQQDTLVSVTADGDWLTTEMAEEYARAVTDPSKCKEWMKHNETTKQLKRPPNE